MTASSNTESNVEQSQAGSQTGGGQTDVSAAHRSAGAEATSDIGQAEAYILQLKKLVADELDHASNLRSNTVQSSERKTRNAEDYDQSLRNLAVQALANNQAVANRVMNSAATTDRRGDHYGESEVSRTVRHSDLAIDRMWNIDEVAAMVAKNPVFMDAIAGAVAAAVASTTSTDK